MPDHSEIIQPGRILSDVIVAAFRANGTTLTAWCVANGIHRENVRQAAFGIWGGEKGAALLDRVIDSAGRETVELLYTQRTKIKTGGNAA